MNPLRISGDFCERIDRVLRDFVSSLWKELPPDRRYPLVRRLDFVVVKVVVVVVVVVFFAFCRDGADDVRDEHRDPSSHRHRLTQVGKIVAKPSSSKSSSSKSSSSSSLSREETLKSKRKIWIKKMTFWNIFIVSKSAIHQRGEHGTAALQVFMSTTTITTVAAASSSAEWCSPCFVVVAAKGRGRGTQRQTRRQNRIDRRRYRRKERDLIKCMSTGRRREKRDPADFDNDYDALREHLMKENGGPIANALNSLGENAFWKHQNGWLNRNVSWKNVYAFLYSNFLEKMPYKRQRQGLAGQEVSRATIRDESDRQLDEFMSRLERDETLRK